MFLSTDRPCARHWAKRENKSDEASWSLSGTCGGGGRQIFNKYVNKKMFAIKKMKRGDVMVAQLAVVSGGLAEKVILGPGPGWEGAGAGKMGGRGAGWREHEEPRA